MIPIATLLTHKLAVIRAIAKYLLAKEIPCYFKEINYETIIQFQTPNNFIIKIEIYQDELGYVYTCSLLSDASPVLKFIRLEYQNCYTCEEVLNFIQKWYDYKFMMS